MKAFLKENFVLIAGIALPLLLAVAFLAATRISAMGVEPPMTPVLYAWNDYNHVNFEVRDGAVYYRVLEPKQGYHKDAQLFLYDPVSGEEKRIALPDVPADGTGQEGVLVTALEDSRISSQPESPDGFIFRSGWDDHYNRGFVFDIFGGGRDRRETYLQKGGLKVKVPSVQKDYYRVSFIGWMINDAE